MRRLFCFAPAPAPFFAVITLSLYICIMPILTTSKSFIMPKCTLQYHAAPQPIPADAVQNGCCLPYVIANIKNSPHPYATQRHARLSSVTLGAAAYYFDFWTEVCAILGEDKTDVVFFDILAHFRNIAANAGGKASLICLILHSLIPSPENPETLIPHCAAMLVGDGVCYGIDAINGVALIPENLAGEDLRAAKAFLRWDNVLRFAVEIDGRDIGLDKIRRYNRSELAHILEAPLLS